LNPTNSITQTQESGRRGFRQQTLIIGILSFHICLDAYKATYNAHYSSLKYEVDFLTNRHWWPITDSSIVMASSSVHDVVNKPQSVDALPTDVSGNQNIDFAAYAAADMKASNTSDTTQEYLPQSQANGISQKHTLSENSEIGTDIVVKVSGDPRPYRKKNI
jgi:hypothetical protein